MLLEKNIAYTVDEIKACYFLCHPENRSKLGLKPYNAHRNLAHIKRVGADLDMLNKSTAFEISGIDACRAAQVSFNEQLVKRSNGMLAPITSSERYLTVSIGHAAAICNAAEAQCKSNQPTLCDSEDGNMCVDIMCKGDDALRKMVTKGWSWIIVKWQAEAQWPTLPDIAQRALNASHGVASTASELETASSIAEFCELTSGDAGKHNDASWAQCVEAAAQSLPP